ncbi:hypothetical protein M975_0076 [Buttiauxella brennerae ATCC 51605]|uniref:Uncharacterized protein n=1 Tax=Buttiauxella brennerae ATCC 51605 TaxID=1354251 RepID=A0A1B7IX73_9ENTR|nr:hypothetical protein [Buttiauxella brennerae]OAT34590.1 hypothetical protein M975_0076 [Buttiauxella brennerae ATCC 51605]
MKIVLDCREIKSIPLIEREVTIDDSKLFVSFSLIGDLNFFFEYYKDYECHDESIRSAEKFIASEEKITKDGYLSEEIGFSKQQDNSKISLLKSIMLDELNLPDDGEGFIYNGDKTYVETLLRRLSSR